MMMMMSWKLKSSYNSFVGNPNDKIMYARTTKRSSSFPVSGRLERRHSLRLFSSSKRLSSSLTRCGSLRQISNKLLLGSDSSSSTEYPSTDCSSASKLHQTFPILQDIFTVFPEVVAYYVSIKSVVSPFMPHWNLQVPHRLHLYSTIWANILHPSIHGATAPYGPWPPS
jgi:hypothetical protein